MKSLLREPLVHFLLIGAALFLLFELFNDPVGPKSDRIVILPAQINYLKANFTRTWQRTPTEKELQGLIDSYVREEIFYREALALGLDKDDTVIRRRMKQKLEFMSDNIAELTDPADEKLQEYLQNNPESFRHEAQVAFRQIFLNIDQRDNAALEEANKLLTELNTDGNDTDPDTLGDSLGLPKSIALSSVSEIARLFGKSFSLELTNIKPGKWTGPIRSGYGLHLVLVTEQIDGRRPELDEIREIVEREWLSTRKKELKESIYNKLREKYTVVFEQPKNRADNLQTTPEVQATLEKQK